MKPKDARKPKPRDGRIKHVSIDAFVERTARLIDLEKEAEKEQSLASLAGKSEDGIKRLLERGRALRGLVISSVEGGLLGNSLVTLEKRASNESDKALPAHKFHPHDIVACKPSKGDASSEVILQGIVYRVKESSITLVCENIDDDKDLSQSVRIEKLSNDVTFTRLKTTLDRLAKVHSGGARASESWRMVDCIFGSSLPAFSKTLGSGGATASDLVFFSPTLDDSQKSAVSHALRAQDLVMVHGPPGTGKTTTVVEIVLQEAINRKQRVLVCSASNVAVDNLVERIQTKVHDLSSAKGKKLKIVRLGHPARLLPQVLGVCLDSLVLRTDSTELADDCVKEIKEINRRLLKLKRHERQERKQLRSDLRYLNKEVRQRHQKAITEVLERAHVVACTLTGCMMRKIDRERFDLVIVDEAAQASECATWSALLKGKRAVLCGDHLQLPPTIISTEAERKGLGVTLFERLHKKFGEKIATMLTTQYRMNEAIMQWSSDEFYKSKLEAHASVACHTLADLEGTRIGGEDEGAGEGAVLHMVDTTGCDMFEKRDGEDSSYFNEGEAEAVLAHARELADLGVSQEDIGVISPYSAQVTLVKQNLAAGGLKDVEVSTVDGFQGREKEAIIITMVRSNEEGNVGFVADARRMNVAVTRARRQCSLICDSETISRSGNKMLQGLVEWFMDNGEYTLAL